MLALFSHPKSLYLVGASNLWPICTEYLTDLSVKQTFRRKGLFYFSSHFPSVLLVHISDSMLSAAEVRDSFSCPVAISVTTEATHQSHNNMKFLFADQLHGVRPGLWLVYLPTLHWIHKNMYYEFSVITLYDLLNKFLSFVTDSLKWQYGYFNLFLLFYFQPLIFSRWKMYGKIHTLECFIYFS